MWHRVKHAFKLPVKLRMKLMESFSAEILITTNFYSEPPSNTKRWIAEERDFIAMYGSFESGSKINLW